MRKIRLTQNQFALVDDSDFDRVSRIKWYAQRSLSGKYYARNGKSGFLHSFLLPTFKEVDHKNGNPLDNRRENLREATHHQNMMNKSSYKNSRSGVKGVWFREKRGRWEAQIRFNSRTIHLGTFEDIKDAIGARRNAEKTYFDTFAAQLG